MNGKSFDVGEVLSGDQPDLPSCVAECRCLKSDDRPAQLTCVDIECPELFSGRPFGCVSQYSSLDQCCQSSEICGNDQQFIIFSLKFPAHTSSPIIECIAFCSISRHVSIDHGKIAEMGECHYEGETYRLNQRMYPNNETCYECLCTEDFNGAVPVPSNSNCKRIDCGVELRHLGEIRSGCVPVYFGNRCCPIDFKCRTYFNLLATIIWLRIFRGRSRTTASSSKCTNNTNLLFPLLFTATDQDAIDEAIAPTSGTDNDGAVCKFGALSLKRGQAIKSTDKCNKCECSTPPLLTCTKTYDC